MGARKRIRAKVAHTLEPGCIYVYAGEERVIPAELFHAQNHELVEDLPDESPPAAEPEPQLIP